MRREGTPGKPGRIDPPARMRQEHPTISKVGREVAAHYKRQQNCRLELFVSSARIQEIIDYLNNNASSSSILIYVNYFVVKTVAL